MSNPPRETNENKRLAPKTIKTRGIDSKQETTGAAPSKKEKEEQTTNRTSKRTTERTKTSKPKNIFIPKTKQRIYVNWDTFPIARKPPWNSQDISQMSIMGIYINKTNEGWVVLFPALRHDKSEYKWTLNQDWIQKYGSTTELGDRKLLTWQDIKEAIQDPQQVMKKHKEKEDAENNLIFEDIEGELRDPPTLQDDETDQAFGKEYTRSPIGYLGVATLNVNKLFSDRDLPAINWIMRHRDVGLIAIQDTRLAKSEHAFIKKKWRTLRETGQIFPFGENTTVGGQAFVLSPEWARRRRTCWSDPSTLAIITEITFNGTTGTIRVISIYWPVNSSKEHPQGLEAQLNNWLKIHRPGIDAEEYIWSII